MNLDKLTYAGNLESLAPVAGHPGYEFRQLDITQPEDVSRALAQFQPEAVMHLAAESHVDRSIEGPAAFVQTNVVGTFVMLESARQFWAKLESAAKSAFRFLHVSTDEVYGSLGSDDPAFSEVTPYSPRSPYSATKAGSDHLAQAYFHTFGLPVLVTNCSNNYGPFQFPEKLIPVVILKALRGEPIPVYGKGENIRDWLYVGDHAEALLTVVTRGTVGETYNIGGNNEMRNLDLVQLLCGILDELSPRSDDKSYTDQIQFVTDRPGHDLRYAIDARKIRRELGWEPRQDQRSGFETTVRWYLENQDWWQRILSGDYRLERLGKAKVES